jgi:hypothetical protein
MPDYHYRAVRVRQTHTGDYLVLFGAPATEIELWAGVPQKKELSDQKETTGFQREENEKRIGELTKFYQNESNIIQNPLLCARRETPVGSATFKAGGDEDASDPIVHGIVSISAEPLEQQRLLQLLTLVKRDLERRVSSLTGRQPSEEQVARVRQNANIPGGGPERQDAETENGEADLESDDEPADDEEVGAVILSESHIFDFWEQIAARVQVLEELERSGDAFTGDTFQGFSKDAMISFLLPVVLVDGQHRLRGAIEAATALTNEAPYREQIEQRVSAGEDPTVVQAAVEAQAARILPVSLLMSNDPAEQVFQFVVVNQKAIPIGKALLGTIVSTSLSNDELERVSQRLEDAGIKLEESRVVAYLTRYPGSPFCGLVERGLAADVKELLPWSVLRSLVDIFQRLEGGRLFHSRIDYAAKWRRDFLRESGVVTGWETRGFDTAYECWRDTDGPWRGVFIAFWKAVRTRLGDDSDAEAKNYWGSARKSQLFNKISLTILAADFFQYLCDTKIKIADENAVPDLVTDWLAGVSDRYFSRDWNLSGVKKDSTGIRIRWSKLWVEYRKDPRSLPRTSDYRIPAASD